MHARYRPRRGRVRVLIRLELLLKGGNVRLAARCPLHRIRFLPALRLRLLAPQAGFRLRDYFRIARFLRGQRFDRIRAAGRRLPLLSEAAPLRRNVQRFDGGGGRSRATPPPREGGRFLDVLRLQINLWIVSVDHVRRLCIDLIRIGTARDQVGTVQLSPVILRATRHSFQG